MRIEARHLTIRYGRRVALDSVSLMFEPGVLVGLIGPNGAGKTSIARAFAGIVTPSEGQILYDGALLHALGGSLSRRIAYLAQSGGADWPLEVEAIVGLGRLPHRAALGPLSEADSAAIERAIRSTELQALRRRRMPELSGGERARALMARALAVEADWLIADEPIAALDPLHQLRAMAILKAETSRGRGVIAVLHDLTLAARFCDRLIALKDGRVAVDVAARDFTAEQVAEVYGVEAFVGERVGERFVLPWAAL
jgi:iron complex transport system ATP-binding protein